MTRIQRLLSPTRIITTVETCTNDYQCAKAATSTDSGAASPPGVTTPFLSTYSGVASPPRVTAPFLDNHLGAALPQEVTA
jgi:hypothetical protein